MGIKDLVGLSESLTKLIDVVSKGIGTAYKPRAIRNEADAEAYRAEVLAKAEAKKIMLEGEAKIELLDRAKKRLVYQELNRQENIEEIAEKATKYLGETVSNNPVDDDWRMRFFQKAQDVSNKEMQEIWAKILANEVSKPGAISYRTLDIVSNLSREEAERFQFACGFVSDNKVVYKLNDEFNFLQKFGWKYSDLLRLREAGLFHSPDDTALSFKSEVNEQTIFTLDIGNQKYKVTHPSIGGIHHFAVITLTKAGEELSALINTEPNQEYFSALFRGLQDNKYEFA